ncbi:MAG TPA: CBS domain-containing protein [Gaiellaceae bacterium]|nr:CBS domain-containing protein [Gaiellaceae bacterium]
MSQQMLESSKAGPALEQLTVGVVMHPGVVTCPLETPLPTVARMMATYRIHAVVVFNEDSDDVAGADLWGVVSDLDLVKASSAGEIDERTAGGTAVTPVVTVERDDTLARAAQLMSEHEVTHLVVVDPKRARPIGVLSTLDVARAVAESG